MKRIEAIRRRVDDWSLDSGEIRNDCEFLLARLERAESLLREISDYDYYDAVGDIIDRAKSFLNDEEIIKNK